MSKSRWVHSASIVAWLLAAGLGYLALGAYHARSGGAGSPADQWPLGTSIPLDASLPTLLIFIHPRCPCSSASLTELEELEARCRGRFAARVVTFRPEGATEGWARSDRVDRPWAFRCDDPGGREAARFGVETSGHVLLFEPSGRRIFGGGITISRGHRGDNPGLDRLIAAILQGPTGVGAAPVFGCPVFAPDSARPGRRGP